MYTTILIHIIRNDIINRATHVPIGSVQVQQLRFARDISRLFNKRFGCTFSDVDALIAGNQSTRIRSLRDPSQKQSEFDHDIGRRITLLDTPDIMLKLIKRAQTDSECASPI